MLEAPEFLHILAADKELLVHVTFAHPDEFKSECKKNLSDAMVADSFTDISNLWNDGRRRFIVETVYQHFLPVGSKYARFWCGAVRAHRAK